MKRVFSIKDYGRHKDLGKLGHQAMVYHYITKLSDKEEEGWFTDIFDIYPEGGRSDLRMGSKQCIVVDDIETGEQKLYDVKTGRAIKEW